MPGGFRNKVYGLGLRDAFQDPLPGGGAFLLAQVDFFTQVNQVPLQDIAAVFAKVEHLRAQHDFVQPGNRGRFDPGDLNIRENVGNGLAQEVFPVRVGIRRAGEQRRSQQQYQSRSHDFSLQKFIGSVMPRS